MFLTNNKIKQTIHHPSLFWIYALFITTVFLFQSCKHRDDDDISKPEESYGDRQFPIFAKEGVTYVLKDDGTLWGRGSTFSQSPKAGSNGYLQLESNISSISMSNNTERLYVIRKDNSLWRSKWLYHYSDPIFAEQQQATEKVTENVKSVQAGTSFAVILKNDGTAWAIGENYYGQFGLGTKTRSGQYLPLTKIASGVRQVAASCETIYLLKDDGSLWSAGSYHYGQLGYEATQNQLTFRKVMDQVQLVRAEESNVMLVKKDGTAWAFGGNVYGQQGNGIRSYDPVCPHKVGDNVKDVFPMGLSCFFIKNDRTLWSAGVNYLGETPQSITKFTLIGKQVTYMSTMSRSEHIVILQNGEYKMVGSNKYRQLSQTAQGAFYSFEKFTMP